MNAQMPVSTHRSGPLNSTQFTDCCGLAVTEREMACPGCHRPLLGTYAERDASLAQFDALLRRLS